jgi:archaellum component FlaC
MSKPYISAIKSFADDVFSLSFCHSFVRPVRPRHPSEDHAFLATLVNNIATVLTAEDDKALADIDNELEELKTQLLMLASSKADYEDVAEEIYRLREQKQKVQVENANRDELRKWIAEMSAFLRE